MQPKAPYNNKRHILLAFSFLLKLSHHLYPAVMCLPLYQESKSNYLLNPPQKLFHSEQYYTIPQSSCVVTLLL